jgi:Amt family ammonium transporter
MLIIPAVSIFSQELSAEEIKNAFDTIWLILAAALVFFMQAGFAMVEIGLTRAKNAGNIIMKNLMDFSVGVLIFWAAGWAIMYGSSNSDFFLNGSSSDFRDWFFQAVFAATAATIVSGAMAERTKFSSYLIYSVFITGLIYPISGRWIWGGGWLTELGFYDFAGSTVVHSAGGWVALAGAMILGPRIGKYVKAGGRTDSKAIMGHNLPLAALGVFILWFGWYGFNAGSTLSGTDTSMARVVVTTTLAAAAGSILSMITVWIINKKPDVSMSLNGALAGLVAITAGTSVVSPLSAVVIGAVGGILVVLSVEFIDKVLHIDDPVGAVSVHGVNGFWGTLAVGIFGKEELIGFGFSRAKQIGVQALGAGAVFLWTFITAGALFYIVKKTTGLRVSEREELVGLDIEEHGTEAYAGFQIFQNM